MVIRLQCDYQGHRFGAATVARAPSRRGSRPTSPPPTTQTICALRPSLRSPGDWSSCATAGLTRPNGSSRWMSRLRSAAAKELKARTLTALYNARHNGSLMSTRRSRRPTGGRTDSQMMKRCGTYETQIGHERLTLKRRGRVRVVLPDVHAKYLAPGPEETFAVAPGSAGPRRPARG